MKKRKRAYIVLLMLYFSAASMLQSIAQSTYRWYRNQAFDYQIIIPSQWQTDEVVMESKHILVAFSDDAEISVKAFLRDEKNIESANILKTYNIAAKSQSFFPIVYNETLTKHGKEIGTISVYQYRMNGKKYIQRTYITSGKNYDYLIECKSTINKFNNYEENFTVALASFQPIAGGAIISLKSHGNEKKYAMSKVQSGGYRWFQEDFFDAAKDRGYTVPEVMDAEKKIAVRFEASGTIIESAPTSEGVILANMLVPDLPLNTAYTVYIWKNGEESLIADQVKGGMTIQSKIILVRGENFICAIVKKDDEYIVRSPVALLRSTIVDAIARFEMTWNGHGDMDLHLASSDGSWHVSFANPSVIFDNNNVYLDVDNIYGFGPENIRVLSLSKRTTVRCFVNYYSGFSPLSVTVKYYDRNNKLVKKDTKKFYPHDINGTSMYNNKSWLVGEYTLVP